MIRRLLFGSVLAGFVVLVGVPLIICVLFGTEKGSRWIIQNILPSETVVERIEGTLTNRIVLIGVAHKDPGKQVSIDTFSLAWQPSALLKGNVLIKSIIVRGVNFSVDQNPPAAEDEQQFDPSLLKNLPLKIFVQQLLIEDIRATTSNKVHNIQKIQVAASYDLGKVHIDSLSLETQPLSAQINAQFFLESHLPFELAVDWELNPLGQSKWKGSSRAKGNLNSLSFKNNISAPMELSQQGTLEIRNDDLQFFTSGNWNHLYLPLNQSPPRVRSEQGHFQVDGSLDDYRINIGSQLLTENISTTLIFQGKGNQQSITINNFELLSDHGNAQLTGMVSWNEYLSLSLAIRTHNFDPAVFAPELPGQLSLNTHIKGRWLDERIWGEIDIKTLKGQLRGHPVSGNGQVSMSDQRITFKNVHITSANNSITLKGTAGKTNANLDFSIDAPKLIALWPTLSGELKGKGYLRGKYANPNLVIKADGRNLRMGRHQVNKILLEADYRSDSLKSSNAHLVASGIKFNGNQIDTIKLKGEGSLINHHWDAKLISPYGMIDTQINGSATGNTWEGQINRLNLNGHEWGTWKLKDPTRIAITKEKTEFVITSDKSCLVHKDAMFCAQLQQPKNNGFHIDAKARSIPLALAKQKLPRNMDVKGTLDAKGWLRNEKQGFTGSFNIALPTGATFSTNQGDERKQISIGHSTLTGSYDENTLKSHFQLALPKNNGLRGSLQIGPGKAHPISGHILTEIDDLSLLDPFVPDFAPLKGTLNADLAISGNVSSPVAKGEILLENGATDIGRLGIQLRQIRIQALTQEHDSTTVALKGRAHSGNGKLEFDGSLKLDVNTGWPVAIHVVGTDFELARLPEAQIWISPDLRFIKSHSSQILTGTITIPQAKLTLLELPESAITPSQDEIIIGKTTKPIKHRHLTTDANLSVTLGKNVSFSGQGLKTKLSGKIDIQKTGDQNQIHGKIDLKNARYRAYGQDLNVRHGEILFSGPADNPWLDIEATRLSKSEDVTAILRVSGPAKAPQTRISSIPPLPESEALAYLLTGRALNRASRSETNMISNAALSYGVGQLSWLTEKLGIDEFEVQENETLEDTLVSVGKYLTPDFYVGTSVGVFNRSPDLVLKRRLTDELSVETYSGESQRIEIKYEFNVD